MRRPVEPILSPNALAVLKRRYLSKNASGRVTETPSRLFKRVAENIAGAEKVYDPRSPTRKISEEFYNMMSRLEFLPNSPTLMNAGRPLQQLSACFVLPVEDSLQSIFEAVKQTALIHQSGGGTGFSFGRLRPRDTRVSSTTGMASGPVSFMKVFNMTTEVIKQGGVRRGANMGVLRVDHPDIMDFIRIKEAPEELANFNLSVAATDQFMDAVSGDKGFKLLHPQSGKQIRRVRARDIFDRIVKAAWKTGEPGLLFMDRINRANPTPDLGPIEATNPCGEQPLLPFESCNLGSINLFRMVRRNNGKWVLDTGKLSRTVRLAVRFLDNVIEVNRYPIPEIEEKTRANRKIGLGLMGFADFLILLGIPYNSERAIRTAERVMALVQKESRRASADLAKDRGVFPNFPKSIYAEEGPRLRNAALTTIAPTGTLSLIAGCSGGIEPIYGIRTRRVAMGNLLLEDLHPLITGALRGAGIRGKNLLRDVTSRGSIQSESRIPLKIRVLFPTAHDIAPEFHVRIQAAFQKHTDNAVAKTVNFPETAGPGEIKKAFLLAYREGCKGITVFRSGSRAGQVLNCSEPDYC